MADFYQNGIVTTLHNLAHRPVEDIESELREFSKKRPMSLILPSLFSELEGDALPNIVKHLKDADYLSEIVIGLDRANEEQYRHALTFFGKLPQHHRVLWNEGPRLQALDAELQELNLAPKELGKGRNVWYCMGYTLASNRSESVALHDCDIVTYDRELLARLIYPVANPRFNYEFCKGFYARVADGKINGRVSRLLVTPLLRALKKVFGEMEYLQFMDSFRYPLAGEFSFRKDIADVYDHKHQDLSPDNDAGGLSKMSIDISKALFRKLATHGKTFNTETFRSIKATYFRIALDFIETYHNDAVMNGLTLDIHAEEKAVELFAQNIMKAGEAFLDKPMETPFIPSWNRVISAKPDILERLYEAVEEDNKEFMSR